MREGSGVTIDQRKKHQVFELGRCSSHRLNSFRVWTHLHGDLRRRDARELLNHDPKCVRRVTNLSRFLAALHYPRNGVRVLASDSRVLRNRGTRSTFVTIPGNLFVVEQKESSKGSRGKVRKKERKKKEE